MRIFGRQTAAGTTTTRHCSADWSVSSTFSLMIKLVFCLHFLLQLAVCCLFASIVLLRGVCRSPAVLQWNVLQCPGGDQVFISTTHDTAPPLKLNIHCHAGLFSTFSSSPFRDSGLSAQQSMRGNQVFV